MADAKDRGLMRLNSRTLVNLNAGAPSDMSLYTVPVGKEAMPTHIMIRDLSADAANAVVDFGTRGGSLDSFLSDIVLGALDAVDKGGQVMKSLSDLNVVLAFDILTATQEFGVNVTTAAGGACTCTMDTFGYEWDV